MASLTKHLSTATAALMVFSFLGCSNPAKNDETNHGYSDEGLLFAYNLFKNNYTRPYYLFNNDSNITTLSLKYLRITNDVPAYYSTLPDQHPELSNIKNLAYNFQRVNSPDTFKLIIFGFKDTIPFIKDSVYHFIGEADESWQYAYYGLLIFSKDTLLFEGITGGREAFHSSLYDSSEITVNTYRTIAEKYKISGIYKYTNLEMAFHDSQDSVFLIQGQSAYLNNYRIQLGYARDVEQIDKNVTADGKIFYTSFTIFENE